MVVAHMSKLYPRRRIQGFDGSNCDQYSTSCSVVASRVWHAPCSAAVIVCVCVSFVLPAQSVRNK